MQDNGLRQIAPRQFHFQPIQNYPGGYVCLIRDVGYGDRYLLMRLRDPKGLASRLRTSFDFEAELAIAWQSKDAESAERALRWQLASGAAYGEWFDLDDTQLRAHIGHEPPPAAARQPATPGPARPTVARPVAATPRLRSGWARRLATAVIVLLLLAMIIAPRFEGLAEIRRFANSLFAAPETPRILTQPTVYRRSVVNGSILFHWTRVRDAKFYEYRWSVNGGKYTQARQTDQFQKTIAGLSAGDVVSFEVRARNGAIRSPFARMTSRVPAARQTETEPQPATASLAKPRLNPAKLRTKTSGKTTVVFSWQPVSGATNYYFRWYLNGSRLFRTYSWTSRTEVSICCRSAGDSIRFEVQATHDSGESLFASVTVHVPAEDSAAQATPILTQSKTTKDGQTMVVRTSDGGSIHVRDCPSTQCAVTGRLMHGEKVQALEKAPGETVAGSSTWIRIGYRGKRNAFVHAPLLEPGG